MTPPPLSPTRAALALAAAATGALVLTSTWWPSRPMLAAGVVLSALVGSGGLLLVHQRRAILAAARAIEALGEGSPAVELPSGATTTTRKLAHAIGLAEAAASRRDELVNAALDDAANQRDLLSSIINASSDGLLFYDRDRSLILANVRCGELLGFSVQELLHTPPTALMANLAERTVSPENYRDQLDRHFARADQPFQDLLTLVEPRRRTLRRASGPVRNHRGLQGRVFTYADITAEWTLDRMKSDFVSTASHELRTPLTSIHGALQLVLSGSAQDLDGEDRELLEISLASTERLVRMVNDLLDFSKLDAEQMPVVIAMQSVASVLDEAAKGVNVLASGRDTRIVTEATPPDLAVTADHDQVVRVLTNLLGNAIKYSPAGASVRIRARRTDAGVEIAVEDEGPGIPADQVDRLFRPFSRVGHQEHAAVAGTGLGLAISRAIIERHGGRIWWERGHPRGSRFVFSVPDVEPADADMTGTSRDVA